MRYSPERKEAVLRKMMPPHNRTIRELAKEERISEATLYNWRQQARDKGVLMPDADAGPERFRKDYSTNHEGPILDWPPYDRVKESPEECAELDANYCATVAFSDEQLGRLLDYFDEHNLWEDTALVVSTDHGYLLGEHDWWAKNRMPCYEEVAHIPLFVHHPDFAREAGTRRRSLTQAIDLMPTFLDFFGFEAPKEVQGKSLVQILENDKKIREAALFGYFGLAINITDGRYTVFLYPDEVSTEGLYQYTLMPTTLQSQFNLEELAAADIVAPFDFTKGARLLRIPAQPKSPFNPIFGPDVCFDTNTVLFDLAQDPYQEKPYRDAEVEAKLMAMMVDLMRQNDAPAEMYERLGLKAPDDCGPHILNQEPIPK